MTLEAFQRYVRILLFTGFGALGTFGIQLGDSNKTLIASIVGFLVTLGWSVWGNKLSSLLGEIQKSAGVESVTVKVDPEIVAPAKLAAATPDGVTVQAVKL